MLQLFVLLQLLLAGSEGAEKGRVVEVAVVLKLSHYPDGAAVVVDVAAVI